MFYFFKSTERMSSATFPTYREDSSSSLTTSSGSSLASSSGGLHMHVTTPPTPPTPIPVMITGPDDSPRRDSEQPDQRLATFYTHDEVLYRNKYTRKLLITILCYDIYISSCMTLSNL